jgi:hypothetical protein
VKKHRTCCYSETDPEGRVEYHKGETELERHERLLEYQIKRVAKLRERKKRASLKEIRSLSLSADNNNNILDVNNNIIYACDRSSDTPTDTSNKNIDAVTKPSTPVLTISAPNKKDKKNNNRNKKSEKDREIKITKEKILETKTTSATSKTSVPTTSNNEDKIKRKRDPNVLQTDDPTIDYIEDFSENSSFDQYPNDDIDGDTEPNVADASVTELNPQSATVVDPGAFDSNSTTSSNNN